MGDPNELWGISGRSLQAARTQNEGKCGCLSIFVLFGSSRDTVFHNDRKTFPEIHLENEKPNNSYTHKNKQTNKPPSFYTGLYGNNFIVLLKGFCTLPDKLWWLDLWGVVLWIEVCVVTLICAWWVLFLTCWPVFLFYFLAFSPLHWYFHIPECIKSVENKVLEICNQYCQPFFGELYKYSF